MAITYTATQVLARALKATDHENDLFIATAEGLEILSVAYSIFWRKLVDAHQGYFAEATADTWTANGLVHALPAAFGRLIAVEYSPSTSQWQDVPEVHPADVAPYTKITGATYALAYRMDGENVHLMPAVTSGSYRVRYLAGPAKITAGTEVIDSVGAGDEFCALYLQSYIKRKEEADIRPYELAMARILDDLELARAQRVMYQPGKIRDVQPFVNRPGGPAWRRRRDIW